MTDTGGAKEDPGLQAARQVVHEKSRLKKLFGDKRQGPSARMAYDLWQPFMKVMIELKRSGVSPEHCALAVGEWAAEAVFQIMMQSAQPQQVGRVGVQSMVNKLNACVGAGLKPSGLIIPTAGNGLLQAKTKIDPSKLKL